MFALSESFYLNYMKYVRCNINIRSDGSGAFSDVIKTFFQDQDQDLNFNIKTKTLKFFQDQDQA